MIFTKNDGRKKWVLNGPLEHFLAKKGKSVENGQLKKVG